MGENTTLPVDSSEVATGSSAMGSGFSLKSRVIFDLQPGQGKDIFFPVGRRSSGSSKALLQFWHSTLMGTPFSEISGVLENQLINLIL